MILFFSHSLFLYVLAAVLWLLVSGEISSTASTSNAFLTGADLVLIFNSQWIQVAALIPEFISL